MLKRSLKNAEILSKKRHLRSNYGITLVALVVTIIVLIILATVTINLLLGENGLITRAQEGARNWKTAEQEELNLLGQIEGYIDSTNIPIPAGFEYLEGTLNEGFVIKHKTEDSEFVWVPVPYVVLEEGKTVEQVIAEGKYPMAEKIGDNYKGILYDFTLDSDTNPTKVVKTAKPTNPLREREPDIITGAAGTSYDAVTSNLEKAGMPENKRTATEFKNQIQKEYNEMISSVIFYGGFYIARYETSIDFEKVVHSLANQKPMDMQSTSGGSWYDIYRLQKEYQTVNSLEGVKTGMIWGSQWDQMMIWMEDLNNPTNNSFYIINSTRYGLVF